MIIEDTESFENGFVSNYWYDADGERMVKTSGENEAIYVNYRASQTYMWTESKSSIKKIMIYIWNISKYK